MIQVIKDCSQCYFCAAKGVSSVLQRGMLGRLEHGNQEGVLVASLV
jgi:hypothetical protein